MAVQTQTFPEGFQEPSRAKSFETAAGGSSLEAVGGIGAIVLGILGLAGVIPQHLTAIAMIVLGAAFLSAGGAMAARYADLLSAADGGTASSMEFGGGITTEFIGGLGGIVLGVLALLGIMPLTLLAVGIIALGATLLLSTAETSRLASLGADKGEHTRHLMHAAASTASGGQVLLGLAAVVLGILALVLGGAHTLTFILIGALCVGASMLFSGTAVASRMMSMMK